MIRFLQKFLFLYKKTELYIYIYMSPYTSHEEQLLFICRQKGKAVDRVKLSHKFCSSFAVSQVLYHALFSAECAAGHIRRRERYRKFDKGITSRRSQTPKHLVSILHSDVEQALHISPLTQRLYLPRTITQQFQPRVCDQTVCCVT